MTALRSGDPAQVGRCCPTTCSRPRCRCSRSCAARWLPDASTARSARSCRDRARPARSWPETPRTPARSRSALTGAGVCRAVARASGPAPGAVVVRRRDRSRREPGQPGAGRQGLPRAGAARPGLARRLGRTADRRRRPQRRRQDDAAGGAGRGSRTWTPAGRPGRGDVTIGYLPQAEELTGTVGQVVFGELAEHEWAADPRSRAVVEALLGGIDLGADVRQLSGGERRRTALAALLRRSYDLLLLDEPTNHLDIEAITWLAGYLRPVRGQLRGRHPRPLVPGRGDRGDLGARRRPGARLRRRLLRVRAGQGRARPHRRGHRPAAPQPAAQGARLAAPRAAGPDQQAASSGSRPPPR